MYVHDKYISCEMRKKLINNMLNRFQKILVRQIKTTVDPEDIQRHSKFVPIWWDRDGIIKPLHTFNNLRVPYIKNSLLKSTKISGQNLTCLTGLKILEVGCGGGILSEGLAELGAEVTGIDASKDLITLAQNHATENKNLVNNPPTYIYSTIEEHSAVNTEKYDAVVASEVIEHVNEKELFVKSCVLATKPGGKLFFTTPSKTRVAQFCYIYLNETIFGAIPKGTHQYEKFMTPNELKLMLEINNCLVNSTRGIIFRSLLKQWSWSYHKLIMFAIEATKKEK